MAKLMSKQTKENVITGAVLAVILAFIFFYIIYPLISVNDMVTANIFENTEYSEPEDEVTFDDLGLSGDSLIIPTDDNIDLATLIFTADSTRFDSAFGTVIVVPSIFNTKEGFGVLIKDIIDRGYNAVIYDQRGSGQSSGEYHTPGIYEGENLNQMIVWLKLHDRLVRPVTVIGFSTGADAAIYASQSEDYIDRLVAGQPYLTPTRWITSLRETAGKMSIPFATTVYYWWYQKKSGFAIERTGVDDIKPAAVPTVLIGSDDDFALEEYKRFIELSGDLVSPVKLSDMDDGSYNLIDILPGNRADLTQ